MTTSTGDQIVNLLADPKCDPMIEHPPQDEHSSDEPLVPIQHLSLATTNSNSNDSSSSKMEEEPVLVKPRRSGRAHKEVQRFKAGGGVASAAASANNSSSAENSRPSSPKQQQQQPGLASPKVRPSLKSCTTSVKFKL